MLNSFFKLFNNTKNNTIFFWKTKQHGKLKAIKNIPFYVIKHPTLCYLPLKCKKKINTSA